MNNKIYLLVQLIFTFGLMISCNSNNSEDVVGAEASSTNEDSLNTRRYTHKQENEDASSVEENSVDQTFYPYDFENKSILVVPNAEFHGDGREAVESKKEWMGLFKTKSGFYLKNVKASIQTVYDPISDNEDGPFTGLKIVPSIKNSCELLLNPIGGMKEQKLLSFQTKEKIMFAGDKINFKYNETNYQVYCTGSQKSKGETAEINDYKLMISDDKYAHAPQLLMQVQPSNEYTPNRISVYLIALIDNDNVPDLILKNGDSFFLYLSTQANEGEIVTPVGREVLYGGC
jgi:hypothetical protein